MLDVLRSLDEATERTIVTRNIFKKIFGCISTVDFLGLYVLLFVTQGHPTWDSIIDTVTMQPLL